MWAPETAARVVAAAELDATGALWGAEIASACGGDADGVRSRVDGLLRLLSRSMSAEGSLRGDMAVSAAVSPGRVRVFMGHTDFAGLGGPTVNACTRENVVVVAARREAGSSHRLVALNANADTFPRAEFDLRDEVLAAVRAHEASEEAVAAHAAGRATLVWDQREWSSYLKALAAHMMSPAFGRHAEMRDALAGPVPCEVWLAVDSTLPHHGGLSSSAALTTAASLCLARLAGARPSLQELLTCDRGEFFLGKSAGCGDRAAIMCSVPGHLSEIASLPDGFSRAVPVPGGGALAVFMADAPVPRLSTQRGAEALRLRFGAEHAAAAGEWAAGIMRRFGAAAYVAAASALAAVLARDAGEAPGLEAWEFGAAREAMSGGPPLLRELAAGGRLERLVPDRRARHSLVFRLLALLPPGSRAAALYGVSECERGQRYLEALAAGRVDEVLELVRWSHNGDRAAVDYRRTGFPPTAWSTTPEFLCRDTDLVAWAASGRDLALVSGAFQRSIPDLDEMADELHALLGGRAALRVAAAGLGGTACVHCAGDEAASAAEAHLCARGWTVRRVEAGAPARLLG